MARGQGSPFSPRARQLMRSGGGGAARMGLSDDNGDAAKVLTKNDERIQLWNTPLTAARAVTFTLAGLQDGDTFRIVRGAGATGGFALNVGPGPLKALATAGTWCEVTYNGTAMVLTASGSL